MGVTVERMAIPRGRTIWVTGLSGAGKTTLCRAMGQLLKPSIPELVLIDGDVVREAFGGDLGYDVVSREQQIRRIQRLARVLSEQGLVVLVSALYASPSLLDWNRQHLAAYFEIYLRAPLAVLRMRDSKGLYRAAEGGSMPNVVGIDIPWLEPARPDLIIDVERAPGPQELAGEVLGHLPDLAQRIGSI